MQSFANIFYPTPKAEGQGEVPTPSFLAPTIGRLAAMYGVCRTRYSAPSSSGTGTVGTDVINRHRLADVSVPYCLALPALSGVLVTVAVSPAGLPILIPHA